MLCDPFRPTDLGEQFIGTSARSASFGGAPETKLRGFRFHSGSFSWSAIGFLVLVVGCNSSLIEQFSEVCPTRGLRIGFTDDDMALSVGGVGHKSFGHSSAFQFEVADAIANGNQSCIGSQSQISREFWFSTVVSQRVILVESNRLVFFPLEDVGMNLISTETKRDQHRRNPINEPTGYHMQSFGMGLDPSSIFGKPGGQLLLKVLIKASTCVRSNLSVASRRDRLSESGIAPSIPRLVNRSISVTLASASGSSAKTISAKRSKLSTAHRVESKSKMMGAGGISGTYRESGPFSGMEFGTLDERIGEGDPDDLIPASTRHFREERSPS